MLRSISKNSPRIYISAAMRSGSTLISGILNGHSKLKIIDNFHLKRFIIGKNEKLTRNIVNFKIKQMEARLNIRYGVKINADTILKNIFSKKKISYKNIYDELILDQLNSYENIKHVGEDAPMSWRFIKNFVDMYKNNAKVIHLVRDPRSVFASWKKLTYQKTDYWGCIFNCIDTMNYGIYLKKKLKKKNYLLVKFEDVLENPKKFALVFCKFLGIKFENNMIQPDIWPEIFKKKNVELGWSSVKNQKKISKFYKDRIDTWKDFLSHGEIQIIEKITKKLLLQYKYKLSNYSNNANKNDEDIKIFFDCINKSEYLQNLILDFVSSGKGSDKFNNDPSNPYTWGARKKNKKKFLEIPEGKKYLHIVSKLKKKYIKI